MAAFTYPGVYIEEVSSGQHTIAGVATSIAAFIGWAPQGPTNEAVMVESFPEFQSHFGTFVPGIYLAYAVNHFFQNGGSQAYIVRLVDTSGGSTVKTASSVIGGLQLFASNPGAWGNSIFVTVSNVSGAGTGQRFNLQVTNANGQTLESYTNLSANNLSAQFAVSVVNSDSNYLSFMAPGGTAPTWNPPPTVAATLSFTIAGAVTAGTFVAGEEVTQSTSGAKAHLVGSVGSSGPLTIGPVVGTLNTAGNKKWTGTTSGAVYTESAVPVQTTTAVPVALNAGATPQTGIDGAQLIPGSTTTPQTFEAALDLTGALAVGTTPTSGLGLLNGVPIFNLLCVPGETDVPTIEGLETYCQQNRAFLIVDAPQNATLQNYQTAIGAPYGTSTVAPKTEALPQTSTSASNAGYYYPWVMAPDPAVGNRAALFPPCGFVAGIFASTDASRGVWKAPAGITTTLSQVMGLQVNLTDMQNGGLNQIGVNCLRQFRNAGNVVWGARTLAGADTVGSEYKYIPIRRLALFLESSLYEGTQWVVFEPNAEPLWGQIRLNVGAFLQGLFLQGAFAGTTPQQAYFVKCDKDNNPDASIALGIVNITVGFAPLYPAEFVVIQITQMLNS
jgi:phage tail sheath protein FI